MGIDPSIRMVVLEHVGFGARDRSIMLYWWDERDGPECMGWWVTPDYVGNNDFFLQNTTDAPTPTECPPNSWRSPNVEMLQLKRPLKYGFEARADGSLVVVGSDAGLTILPDNLCKVDFSQMVWREEGWNHGRPMYQAYPAPKSAPVASSPSAEGEPAAMWSARPELLVALGALCGVAAVLAVQHCSKGRR